MRRIHGLFVALVTLASIVAAFELVRRYGPIVPHDDDLHLVPQLTGAEPISWEWLWSNYSDHRLVIPKLINVLVVRAAGGDMRAGMYFQVIVHVAITLGMLYALHRRRGHTLWTDAFVPLLWLTWGNAINFMLAWQIQMALTGALLGAVGCIAIAARRMSASVIASIGVMSVCMPLCGGGGAMQAVPIAAWLGLHAWSSRGSLEAGQRRAMWAAWVWSFATIAVITACSPGFERSFHFDPTAGVGQQITTGVGFLTLAFGEAGRAWRPWSIVLTIALAGAPMIALANVARADVEQRWRALGLLACIAGVLCIAASIGFSRVVAHENAGLRMRYVTMPAMLLGAGYLAAELWASRRFTQTTRVVLFAALVAALPYNIRFGLQIGREFRERDRAFVADVHAGVSSRELAATYAGVTHVHSRLFTERLRMLRSADLPPFRGVEYPPDVDAPHVGPFAAFTTQPTHGWPPERVIERVVGGRRVVVVPMTSELRFPIAREARGVRGVFGFLPIAYAREQTPGATFVVEVRHRDGRVEELLRRKLAPSEQKSDRGAQELEITWSNSIEGELALRIEPVSDSRLGPQQRTYWGAIHVD